MGEGIEGRPAECIRSVELCCGLTCRDNFDIRKDEVIRVAVHKTQEGIHTKTRSSARILRMVTIERFVTVGGMRTIGLFGRGEVACSIFAVSERKMMKIKSLR